MKLQILLISGGCIAILAFAPLVHADPAKAEDVCYNMAVHYTQTGFAMSPTNTSGVGTACFLCRARGPARDRKRGSGTTHVRLGADFPHGRKPDARSTGAGRHPSNSFFAQTINRRKNQPHEKNHIHCAPCVFPRRMCSRTADPGFRWPSPSGASCRAKANARARRTFPRRGKAVNLWAIAGRIDIIPSRKACNRL